MNRFISNNSFKRVVRIDSQVTSDEQIFLNISNAVITVNEIQNPVSIIGPVSALEQIEVRPLLNDRDFSKEESQLAHYIKLK